MSTKNQPGGDDKTADLESLQASQERSFWPTIQPLSLCSDTCSDDSFSNNEPRGDRYQSEEEIGKLDYPIRVTRTGRTGVQSTRGANQDSSPERVSKKIQPPKSTRRHNQPTSWNDIPKQPKKNNQNQRTKLLRANRKSIATPSPEENSCSDDRSAQATLKDGWNGLITEESGSRHQVDEKTIEPLTTIYSPSSRAKEYNGSSTSEIGVKKLGSPFDLQRRHRIITNKKSDNLIVNEKQYDSDQESDYLNQISKPHQGEAEMNGKPKNGISLQHPLSNLPLDDTNGELELEIDDTHKAMGDIKAKFISLGMHPST